MVNDWFSTSAPGGFYRIHGIAKALHDLGNHAKRPDARFLFVRDGRPLDSLSLQSKEVGLSLSVTFTGRVPRNELPGLCARMDIGLSLKPFQGRRTIGTFPQKIPEYMAVGCAPVSRPL